MKTSIIYSSPHIYALFMKVLYGTNYKARYEAISREIPNGVAVLDVCCGDCALYSRELKGKVSYLGIDINPYFQKTAKKKSIEYVQMEVERDDLPSSDYVVMQGSLYQFMPA